MPKGKKCVVCGQGRMRRGYTRSYCKGFKFTEECVIGREIYKGSFDPQGWLCDHCGIFIIDESNYFMHLRWNERKEDRKRLLNELKEEIDDLKDELNEYQKEYVYTEIDIEIKRKSMLYRFWNIRGEIGTRNYLRGLRDGNKQSDKYYEEKIERMKLTDDQILQKAKLINTRRKLGYT